MTAGQFHRPKPGNVISAFDRPELGGKSIFCEKTNKKQGGSMFNVPPPSKAQRDNKQQIAYSKAVPR